MEVFRNPEAAKFLKMSTSTLAKWRHYGKGPRFLKCGSAVLYRREDLEAWLNQRSYFSTSEYETTPGPGRPQKRMRKGDAGTFDRDS